MFRLFFVLAFGFYLPSSFGASLPANHWLLEHVISNHENRLKDLAQKIQLIKLDTSNLEGKINDLDKKIQGLTNRMNGARVSCHDRSTGWEPYSDAPIMYLDRHHVQCPSPYFLTRFRLVRAANRGSAHVRYLYRCCKFIL